MAAPSTLVEGNDHSLAERVRLAGEDEAGGDLVLLEGEVAFHAHLAFEQLGATSAAHARPAGERHFESGCRRGIKHVALVGMEIDLAAQAVANDGDFRV